MSDKYAMLRRNLPELVAEAKRQGGINPRAQLIVDLLAERDELAAEVARSHAECEMSDDIQLPELPDYDRKGVSTDGFSGVAMARYACTAVLADRERRAQPAPGAEAQYRLLEAGEIIEATDEFIIDDDAVTWVRMIDGGHLLIGAEYSLAFKAMRRPVAANSGKAQAPHQTGESE